MKNYLVMGWGDKKTDKNYQELFARIPNLKVIKTTTRNPKLSLGVKSLEEIVEDITTKQNIKEIDNLVGFSVGAIIAIKLAQKIPVRNILLCSLPPILGKRILKLSKKEVSDLTKTQIQEISVLEKPENAILIYGEKEGEKQGVQIKGCGHKIEGEYINKIGKLFK